jgi:hypothetical protein
MNKNPAKEPPKPDPPVNPHYSVEKALRMVGKTVVSVEIGQRPGISGVHQSELLVIRFTDGATLAIHTGSNAENICSDLNSATRAKILKPDEFHTDLVLEWFSHPE